MMLFGSVLSVSASEVSINTSAASSVGVTHYCIQDNYTGWSYLSFLESVRTLSVKLSDRTMHYFVSNVPLHYQAYFTRYDSDKTLDENLEAAAYNVISNQYFLIDDSGSRYFSLSDCDYYFYSITIMDSSTISECNYTPITYDYSEHVYNSKNMYEDRDILYYILTGTDISFTGDVSAMEEDATFAFTGFTAGSTGKTGHIKANWTGTTHDDKIETYKEAKYTVHAGYAWENPIADAATPVAKVESNIFGGDIADKGFLKTYNLLKPENENQYLRYLKVIPYYTIGEGLFGQSYKGLPCTIWLNSDGSIEKVVNDNYPSTYDSDIPTPKIVMTGNGYEFGFDNSTDDYYIEMQGRWYTVDDIELYKEKLMWKYKYQTLLKTDLSDWVLKKDEQKASGLHDLNKYGSESFNNMLISYPIDDRTYTGGTNAIGNYFSGYNDALSTLKMLLEMPNSLYNGVEIYVRYYVIDEGGNIKHGKWLHWYDDLADPEGSSGSDLDDDPNGGGNGSDDGLDDDEKDELEKGGNSRDDDDIVPDDPSIEDIDFSSLGKSFLESVISLFQYIYNLPELISRLLSFFPSYVIYFIGLGILAAVILRIFSR